jgi:polyisoprenoid-binding protein YceI
MSVYRLDPTRSRFTVQAFARGMLAMLGHDPIIAIRDFTGELHFAADQPEQSSLQMTIKAESLEVADNVKAQDKPEIQGTMQREVLETARYPLIEFRSTAVTATRIADNWYRLQLRGELTLHDVKGTQDVDAQLRLADGEARLSGEFKLLQTPYRIKLVSALGGMIKLKDELKFSFDIVGERVDA